MVEQVVGLAAWFLCFELPHPRETLRDFTQTRKIFTKLNKFILAFTSYSTSNAPKTMGM
jgi:hypothetical protein